MAKSPKLERKEKLKQAEQNFDHEQYPLDKQISVREPNFESKKQMFLIET